MYRSGSYPGRRFCLRWSVRVTFTPTARPAATTPIFPNMDGNTLGSYGGSLVARAGGLHPPPEVLLSWPKPNYVDPEERGWGPPILLMVVLGITFLVYCARMWARLVISKNFGLDDILVSMAMLPLFGLTISSVLGMYRFLSKWSLLTNAGIRIYGFQWHVWDQTQETLVTTREIAFAIELNYMLTSTLIKVSILCFYRRIGDRLTNQFIYCKYLAKASLVHAEANVAPQGSTAPSPSASSTELPSLLPLSSHVHQL